MPDREDTTIGRSCVEEKRGLVRLVQCNILRGNINVRRPRMRQGNRVKSDAVRLKPGTDRGTVWSWTKHLYCS